MSRAIAITSTLVLAMVGVAWLELRTPDFGQALAFFTSPLPTLSEGEAVLTAFAWMVVIIAAFATLVNVASDMRNSRIGRPSTSYAWLLLVAGLMLLTVGALRHSLPSASACCALGPADVREAIGLAH